MPWRSAERALGATGWKDGTIIRDDFVAQVLTDIVFTRKPVIKHGLGHAKILRHIGYGLVQIDAQATKLDPEHFGVRVSVQPYSFD